MKKNKIRLGILWAGYCCESDIVNNLNPWFNQIQSKDNFVFSCVSTPFIGYEQGNNHETIRALDFLLQSKLVQYVNISSEPMTEAEARNSALQPLLKEKCDYILILDSDERHSEKDIHNLLYTLNNEDNQLYNHFKIEFKNLVFNNNSYVKNFAPKRIWKVIDGNIKLSNVRYDNDMLYIDESGNQISDDSLSCKKISSDLINPIHASWNNYDRSYKKIRYAEKRWSPPNGFGCSYKINEENKCIEFNENYYKLINEPIPEVFTIK